jgi:hypothetical protein
MPAFQELLHKAGWPARRRAKPSRFRAPHTPRRVLVTFEVRADNIAQEAVLDAARPRFSRIRQLERELLPPGYQCEHIEMYELML